MKKIFLILGLFLISFGAAFAASDSASHDVTITVSEVVIIELNDTSTVALTTVSPGVGNAGQSVTGETDNSKSLAYTSLVSSGTTRNITAELDANISLPGLALWLSADNASGGVYGTGLSDIALSTTAANIVTGIGSCATDNGAATTLTYALVVTDENLLEIDAVGQTVTVTLTLTDAT
jgi:septal ring-binding cell division protein DamX